MIACTAALILIGVAVWRFQRVDRWDNGRFTDADGKLFLDKKLFSGTVVDRFPAGEIYMETHYVDGLQEGVAREYAFTGALRRKSHYKHGKKDGLQEGWYLEGPKRFEQNYRDGILEGLQTQWHLNGKIFDQQTFADGVEVQRKVLFPTAEVYSNYVKRDNRKYGIDGGALCFETKKEGER